MGVVQEFPEQLNHHHPALCEGGGGGNDHRMGKDCARSLPGDHEE